MRVLVAMSGGVDSSLAAARLVEEGHDVVGATLKLWGGAGDSGCCSLADVIDARRVADHLGIAHHVFNYEELFEREVVAPYVAAHAEGRTPNPCVECNRSLKFGALEARAERLGFDAVATGHHARVEHGAGAPALRRGVDRAKDQSYVLAVLGAEQLARARFPIGELTKAEVRSEARRRALRTADKPDSQDVCFISATLGGRSSFLGGRIPLHAAAVVSSSGEALGEVAEIELLTVGQRRGVGVATGERRYVLELDVAARRVTLGTPDELQASVLGLERRSWTGEELPPGAAVEVQASAHGATRPARLTGEGLAFDEPVRRVAPGQLVALYQGDRVVGSGIAGQAPG
ncbi:MAG TPA: tRNA 2-thiouridine(34) synthase MnmA [Acidimicrobiales bacterium]|nr:tRNA 2-thiouridine(34) synthase MnmA [Acidimicrobiales bacterium]